MRKEVKTVKVSFRIPERALQKIDKLISKKLFKDRTDFFKHSSALCLQDFKGEE